ncbi:MAG: hypothetical protein IT576_19890 [Verrucomicrobiales bacterium]|nr:hypothetical protein [Verrucomicrobiales bacterium]
MDIRIDEIVLRALEKTPELRFATAAEFRSQVENVQGGKTVAQTASPASLSGSRFRLFEERDGRRRIIWRGVFVAVLAVLAIALMVGAASALVAKGAAPFRIIVALAGIAAFLTVATAVRLSLNSGVSPDSEFDRASGPPRFSRAAIVGACWVPVTFFSFVAVGLTSNAPPGGPSTGPEWWQLAILMPTLIVGVAGPFGTTILGWVAVSQIRRSAGKVHGLALALFDGLLFPLMILSAVIAMACTALAKMFVDFYANPLVAGHAHIPLVTRMANGLSLNKELAVITGVIAAIVVNVLIVRAVLRAVRKDVSSTPPASRAVGNEVQVASIAIILALIATALGALAAIRHGGAWPAMALSLLFAGMAILMALPVSRSSVGKSALIIAALGAVIWPLVALVVRETTPVPHVDPQGPEIQRVDVTNEQAVVKARGSDGAGMIFLFGTAENRWTPGGLYLDAMFDVSLASGGFERGARWNIKTRHGTVARYRVDGPAGPLLGKIVFKPGTPAAEADGAYVIGEFRPDAGAPLPIAVKIEKDQAQSLALVSGHLFDESGNPISGRVLRFVYAGTHPEFSDVAAGFISDGPTGKDGAFRDFELPGDRPWQVMLLHDGRQVALSAALSTEGTTAGLPPCYELKLTLRGDRLEASIHPDAATAAASKDRNFPTGAHISRNHHSVMVTHDQAETALHYVLYYAGDCGTTSAGSQNLVMNTWVDEGSVKLKNGRTFGYRREARYPDELNVNGKAYDLRKGRVLVLHDDGTLEQVESFPALPVARDPEALAKTLTPKPLPPPERIDFKVIRVENPPGTRNILLHFERDSNYGLAIEVWQDITRSQGGPGPAPDQRDWRHKEWVGVNGPRVLRWTLPNEFTPDEAKALAKEMARKWKGTHPLPDGAVPEFATALHRDGWKYHLVTKVLREPGSPRPPAPAGTLFAAEQRINLPADSLVRLTLDQSANDGPKMRLGEELVFKTAPDRATGFVLRWHAYPAQQGKFGNRWILDLADPDTGVIFHRIENSFIKPVKLASPDVPPLPHVIAARQLAETGTWIPFHLLHAEESTAPGAALTAWWDVFATVAHPGDGPVPAFQMPPPTGLQAYNDKLSEPTAGGGGEASCFSKFGPVIERVITHPGDGTKNYFLDLDSGNFVQAPDDVRALLGGQRTSGVPDETIAKWATTSEADFTIDETTPEVAAIFYGVFVSNQPFSFDTAESDAVWKKAGDEAVRREIPAATGTFMLFDPKDSPDDAVLFETLGGNFGLLQIQGTVKVGSPMRHTRNVKIRYKLLEQIGEAGEDNHPLARKGGNWTTAMRSLAAEIGKARGLADAKPDGLVAWGPEQDGMQSGLLISDRVAFGDRLKTRLVFRNVSPETKELKLTLTKHAIELSARNTSGTTIPTTTPMLLGSNARFPITLKSGEQVEMVGWSVQFGGSTKQGAELACHVDTGFGKVKVKFNLQNLPLPDTGEIEVTVTPTFHQLPASGPSASSIEPDVPGQSVQNMVPDASLATKPGSYDIKPGLKLVITAHQDEKKPASQPSVTAELVWQAEGESKPSETYDIQLSDGLPYAVAWRTGGDVLWISCGTTEGDGEAKNAIRYLRVLTIRAPGDVEERPVRLDQPDDAPANRDVQKAVPADVRRAFEALENQPAIMPQPGTAVK